jgi:hypothetical protein
MNIVSTGIQGGSLADFWDKFKQLVDLVLLSGL